jgi:hypothetical protein
MTLALAFVITAQHFIGIVDPDPEALSRQPDTI